MKEFETIRKDIQNKIFKPIYFLWGDEPYFIDELTNELQKHVLTEDEKVFDQHIFYGNDIDIETIILRAKQFPMGAKQQLVVVKEAQNLSRSMDKLAAYAEAPVPSTILVFNYKYKKPDGRSKYVKAIKKNGIMAQSAKIYENQLPNWVDKQARSKGLQLEEKVKFLLSDFIGTDLSRMDNELNKLSLICKKGESITPAIIEKHIGISKDYNNFELTKAISTKNEVKAFTIIKYFGKNPKDNPLVLTISALFGVFSKLMLYHALPDKSKGNVAAHLKINPYFVGEYVEAARHYPIKKVTQIISFLREADMQSKGVGASGNVTREQILTELLYKIFKI